MNDSISKTDWSAAEAVIGTSFALCTLRRPSRKRELNYRAARFVQLCPRRPPMGIDNGPGDRQSHPDAARLRCVESLENALKMRRIDARPRVAYCHDDAGGLAPCFSWLRPKYTPTHSPLPDSGGDLTVL